jgi:hypothetical protein
MKKAIIIRGIDEGRFYNIVRGTCRSIVYRRIGDQTHLVMNGISLIDWLRIKKPIKNMALWW